MVILQAAPLQLSMEGFFMRMTIQKEEEILSYYLILKTWESMIIKRVYGR